MAWLSSAWLGLAWLGLAAGEPGQGGFPGEPGQGGFPGDGGRGPGMRGSKAIHSATTGWAREGSPRNRVRQATGLIAKLEPLKAEA